MPALAILLPLPALAQVTAAPLLAPVSAVTSCADLLGQDLTVIGGAGSQVTAATEATSDGIAVCSVTGTLAPQIGFQVLLPPPP